MLTDTKNQYYFLTGVGFTVTLAAGLTAKHDARVLFGDLVFSNTDLQLQKRRDDVSTAAEVAAGD